MNNNNNIIDYKYNNSCNNNDNNNQNEISLEIIKDSLINNIIVINNNNNSDNNNICNKVFNNIFIRRIIFNHLNIFNILYPVGIHFRSSKQFQQFKYKEYLHRVSLDFEDDQFELNQLPINIKHITIRQPKKINGEHYEIISVPDHIESVNYIDLFMVNYANNLSKQPHSSKIKTLNIHCYKGEEILPNQIPNSVTDLTMRLDRLSNNVLPSNLKKLSISNLKSFEDNCLQIESLTHIRIENSTPSILHQLSTPLFKNLIKLEFRDIYAIIDSDIQFPDSLKELIINCTKFNYTSSNKIKSRQPSNGNFSPIRFPSSLENLSIIVLDEDEIYFESFPPNLKSLSIQISSIIDNKGQSILPDTLEKLVLISPFNQELPVDELPSSLTYLEFADSFDQVIDVNVLPSKLDTLILGYEYSQVINPLAIPQQLKLLQIKNLNYPHSINLTPLTHPNTAISLSGDNINLYYQATSPDYNQIRVLRLPERFRSPLSTLQLQNKSNLEYLHLDYVFNHPIKLSDLPIQNNIKTLQLSENFIYTINLEYFQNLETLIIPYHSNPTIITTTTTTIIDDQQQQYSHYNNYKLKNIIVSPKNVEFFKQLDINFYQFIKYNNK